VDDPAGARPLNDPATTDPTATDHPTDPAAARPGERVRVPDGLEATLVLVRHGESELIVERRFQGRLETPLSATGRAQSALVARRLARPLDRPALPLPTGAPLAIVHSPLARAAETAIAIESAMRARDSFGQPVARRADDGLLEIGQGAWEGRLASDIEARDGDRLAAWRLRPTEAWAPGGESLADVRTRVGPAIASLLDELAAAGRPGSIRAPQVAGYRDPVAEQPWTVVVAHDGVFKVLLLAIFDLPLERFWMWTSELCGISIIEFRAGRPVIRAMNLTEHLATLRDEVAQAETEERARSGAL
jgi:broad specificity phosphatase PhoE